MASAAMLSLCGFAAALPLGSTAGAAYPYDPLTDLTPITPLVAYANVLVVNRKIPAHDVSEIVAWAKANPNAATFGSGGCGTTNPLAGELLKSLTGAPLVHVPCSGP